MGAMCLSRQGGWKNGTAGPRVMYVLATTWQSKGARLGPREDHEGGGPGMEGVPGQLHCSTAKSTLYLETVRHRLLLRP